VGKDKSHRVSSPTTSVDSCDENPRPGELVLNLSGAVQATLTFTLVGPPGSKVTADFTWETGGQSLEDPTVADIRGRVVVPVPQAGLLDRVDAKLGDPDEGANQVRSYVQRDGE
jgi:hypothetical protein